MMKSYFIFSLAAICVFVATAFTQSQNAKFVRSENAVDGRYIVLLEERFIPLGAAAADIRSHAKDVARGYGASIEKNFSSAVKGFSATMTEAQAIKLRADRGTDERSPFGRSRDGQPRPRGR